MKALKALWRPYSVSIVNFEQVKVSLEDFNFWKWRKSFWVLFIATIFYNESIVLLR